MTDEATTDRRERYGPGYSDQVHELMAQRRAMEQAGFFLPHLRPGIRVLDVGAGPGSITLDLAERVAPGEVVGIDIEPLQVERARTLAAERKVTNVRFETGDAYALPFPEESFDAVFAHAVLFHLRDPLAALKEFRRVLRSGGMTGIRDPIGIRIWEPTTSLLADFELVRRRWSELRRGPAGVLDFRQRRLLLDAGFARTEGFAQVESFGTSETVRQCVALYAGQFDQLFGPTAVAEGWADEAMADAIVAELRAWGERPDSFGCWLWCAAVGWVDGDAPDAKA